LDSYEFICSTRSHPATLLFFLNALYTAQRSCTRYITPAIKYPKAVIPAKAGIQENTLDAGSSPALQSPGIILPG
jgi:hypothetical protein